MNGQDKISSVEDEEMETAILSYQSASSESVFKQLNNLQIDYN